ncbi:hypothetical protein J2W42_001153 [Rhizobium tibeticum]|nr:hypothetical protein [Rhizobium tibeticum]
MSGDVGGFILWCAESCLSAIGAVAVIARGSPANFLSLVRTVEIV